MRLISKKTLKEGGILLFATVLGGFLNYLFNIFIGRMLTPSEYSVVVSLFSVFVIISVPIGTIQTVVAKYTASFNVKGDIVNIKNLILSVSNRLLIGSLLFFLIIVIFSRVIADFLHISSILPVIFMGTILLPASILPANRGVLQGLQKFFDYSINGIVEVSCKLLFGILLVSLGLGVSGAVFSLTLAGLIALGISLIQLKDIYSTKTLSSELSSGIKFYEIYKYSLNVILNVLCFTVLTNITMVLVKHYFESNVAGYYAGAEIISKIILFVSGIIPILLFPKTASLYAQNIDSRRILIKSLVITALAGICFIGFCYFLNELIIRLFFGSKYIEGSSLLAPLSIVMTFYTLFNIMATYQLSVHKFDFLYSAVIITLLQILLIIIFHKTLFSIIIVLLGMSAMLVVFNLYYSLKK